MSEEAARRRQEGSDRGSHADHPESGRADHHSAADPARGRRADSLEVNSHLVQQVFRKELHMGYRTAKTVPIQSNHERSLVLRQQYSLRLLPMLESGDSMSTRAG